MLTRCVPKKRVSGMLLLDGVGAMPDQTSRLSPSTLTKPISPDFGR
jgi:hypothetical protein